MERIVFIAVVVGVCVILSFLFSGMEAGVLALNRLRIRQMARAGDVRAGVLMEYLESPENFLWTILVGNTLTNLFAVTLVVLLLHKWLGQWPMLFLIGFIAVVFLFYTFCELLPKMLFRMFPNRLTIALAGPFRVIHRALSPVVILMTRLSQGLLRWTDGKTFTGLMFGSREEMRLVMQESAQGFSSEERQMINRVLDLQNIRVQDVAIPMPLVASVGTQTTIAEALKISQERKASRMPVWRGDARQRRVVGILSLRAVMYQADLDPAKTAGFYVKPALYMQDDMRLEAALKRMQRSGQRLAIVLNRDQREIGIITLQDILKVIFGDVRL
jgi:putative hemolysin